MRASDGGWWHGRKVPGRKVRPGQAGTAGIRRSECAVVGWVQVHARRGALIVGSTGEKSIGLLRSDPWVAVGFHSSQAPAARCR